MLKARPTPRAVLHLMHLAWENVRTDVTHGGWACSYWPRPSGIRTFPLDISPGYFPSLFTWCTTFHPLPPPPPSANLQ